MLKEGDLVTIKRGAISFRNRISFEKGYEYRKTYIDSGNQVAIVSDIDTQQEIHVPIRFIEKV